MYNEEFKIKEDEKPDLTPLLREEEGKLIKIIEAIEAVQKVPEWNYLQDTLFSPLTDRLVKQLMVEANRKDLDQARVNQLQGEIKWSQKFSRMDNLKESFKKQLTNIKNQLYGKR